jgi:hypothetical protein
MIICDYNWEKMRMIFDFRQKNVSQKFIEERYIFYFKNLTFVPRFHN